MVKNKKFVFFGLILFLISILLNLPFPNKNSFGDELVSVFEIPLATVYGVNYIGIASFLLLMLCLYFLVKSLKKYRVLVVILTILLTILLPQTIATTYQKTFATDIYAVSYEKNESQCEYNRTDEKTIHFACEFPFENYSKKDVNFTISFYDKYRSNHFAKISNNVSYDVSLQGYEKKSVKLEANIDVSEMNNPLEVGTASGIGIIMTSGEERRNL